MTRMPRELRGKRVRGADGQDLSALVADFVEQLELEPDLTDADRLTVAEVVAAVFKDRVGDDDNDDNDDNDNNNDDGGNNGAAWE